MKRSSFRLLLALTLTGMLPAAGWAQTTIEALRFSMTSPSGTARGLALGGAMTAVGGDFSAATLNPAGLGLYRRTELVISPGFRNIENSTEYLDGRASDNRFNFGFANMGLVISQPMNSRGGLKSWAVGIGFNQQFNTHRRTSGNAYNAYNSIGDFFAGQANGLTSGQLDAYSYAAWRSYAIDNVKDYYANGNYAYLTDNLYEAAFNEANVQQSFNIVERGRTNQWTISGALNFDDEFFVGVGIGIMDFNYRQELQYNETDVNGHYNDPFYSNQFATADSVQYRIDYFDQRRVYGAGVNLTVGFLYQPLDFVRIGASIQTPTYASMTVEYSPEMYLYDRAGRRNPSPNASPSDNIQAGSYNYFMTTPFRANGGIMFLLGEYGLITGDVEYTDYRNSGYDPPTDGTGTNLTFSAENDAINRLYTSAVNYRAGAELRLESFYLRGGYARYGSPLSAEGRRYADMTTYNSTTGDVTFRDFDATREMVSAGLGYRKRRFSMDIAYTRQRVPEMFNLYSTPDVAYTSGFSGGSPAAIPIDFSGGTNGGGLGAGYAPKALTNRIIHSVVLTLGFTLEN